MTSGSTPADTQVQYARCGQRRPSHPASAAATHRVHSSQITYRRRPGVRLVGVHSSHQTAGHAQKWCVQRESSTTPRPGAATSET